MTRDVSAVLGGAAYVTDIERRLARYFERAEPRQRAMAYLRGLLSPAERKNSWQLAEVSGDTTPYGVQHLAAPRAVGARRHLRRIVPLCPPVSRGPTGGVGDRRNRLSQKRALLGRRGPPIQWYRWPYRQFQIGVFLAYASPLGQALLDRELYVPKTWTDDPARYQQAGIPEDRRFATKPQMAQRMLQRALAAGVPAR